MSTRPLRTTASILLVLALVLAACTGADQSTEDTFEQSASGPGAAEDGAPLPTEAADTAESDDDRDAPTPDSATGDLGSGAIVPTSSDVATGREIIYTATLSVEVNDVAAAAREAGQIIQSLGGLLFGQETAGGSEPRTTLVFRVLPEDFGEALERLGGLGSVRDQRVSADDVTERVVDLESRINTAAVSVERLRSLLEAATDIEDIATLENQLLQRETNLETLRGQLRTIQDQVDLATITVTISEAVIRPGISIDVTSYPGVADAGLSCPGGPALEVEQGTATTLCFEITNVGDAPLTDLTLTDPVLDVTLDDLTLVFGTGEETLEPGASVVYYSEWDVQQTLRLQTRVAAVPLDEAGQPLEGRGVADTAIATIVAVDPGGLPGFGDGLEASWDLLSLLGGLIVLGLGAAVPFLWIIPVIWLVARWLDRRRSPRVLEATEEDERASEVAGV